MSSEPSPTCGDIVLFCHPRNVANLVQAFETEITHAAGALPLFVLWSGTSAVLHQGVIVLEWEGAVPTAFLQSLARDHEIFDFVPYDWVKREDDEESDEEPGMLNTQEPESNQVERAYHV